MPTEKFNKRNVSHWMRDNWDIYESATELAENCAEIFEVDYEPGPLDDSNHWIWDLAVQFFIEKD